MTTAKEKFDSNDGNTIKCPIERLEYFCSLAMGGQDWLDCDQMFTEVKSNPLGSNSVYVVTYSSEENCFSGELAILAENLVEAQDKFLHWLRNQPTYTHLWGLTFSVKNSKMVIA